MIHRNDLDSLLSLLQRQQIALASHAEDAAERLDVVNQELQRTLLKLQPLGRRQTTRAIRPADREISLAIGRLLTENRTLLMRRTDQNRRALQVLFRTEPLVYTR